MASFGMISRELSGAPPPRAIVKGNHTPYGTMDMSGLLNAKPLKHEKYFVPQRLYVTAPLDEYGRPLREFTVQSKLINPLPANCMCHLESFTMNNFVGFTQSNLYGSFKATIVGQTMSVGATPTLTITLNPQAIVPQVGGLVTFITAEGYRYMGYVSTATAGAPVITIINPAAITSGSIPEHQYPVFNTGGTVAAQTIVANYTWEEAVGSAGNDIGQIQVELMSYTNSEVFDTATGTYSSIIGVVPTEQGSVEVDYFSPASIQNAGYPISDPNLINNRQVTFRISYASPTGNQLVPLQANQGQVYPYNLTDVAYFPLSGGCRIPWGGTVDATGNYVNGATQKTAKVFPLAPIIRFCLVFLPMYGITKEYE